MRIKLMLAALLFLLPSIICGSKESKSSEIGIENLPDIDVSDELDAEFDNETTQPTFLRRCQPSHTLVS